VDPRACSGGTTDSGERSAAKAELSRAVGSVREGAIAMENLGQLLRSPRVGPRSLSRALPALQEAPQALVAAFLAVERAARVVADVAPEEEASSVLSGARAILDELRAELAELRGSVGARARLMLEARVRRVRQACAPALALCDALGHAAEPRPVVVDLAELLEQRWPVGDPDDRAPRSGAVPRIAVHLAAAGPISADPVLLLPLLEAMLRGVAEGGKASLGFVSAAETSSGGAVRAEPATPDGATLRVLPVGAVGARALQLARLLARVAGLALHEGQGTVTLELP
jgi:hypothetical protein